MNSDDELRRAFERVAPRAPDAARVRGQLGPAMTRARRNHRIRRGIAATTLSLAVAGGGVAAALHFGGGSDEIDTRTSTLPPPEVTASPPTTTVPDPSSTSTPSPGDGDEPATVPPPSDTSTPPPEVTTSTAPATTTTGAVGPDTISGPHTTPCGSVTFRVDSVVTVESHTVVPGYEFSTEDDGTTEVRVKWDEGPGDECRVEAHLEEGELEIRYDED